MSESRIEGLAELQRFLNQLPSKIEKNIMRSALRQGANVIMDEIRQNAPRDTGLLAKGIRTSTNVKGSTVFAYIKPRLQHYYLALFFEYGVKRHSLKKGAQRKSGKYQDTGRKHPGISAKPFFRPAFDKKKGQAVVAVGLAIQGKLTALGIETPDVNVEGDDVWS